MNKVVLHKTVKRCMIVVLVVLGILVLAVLVMAVGRTMREERLRRAWKGNAIPEIVRLADNRDWIAKEVDLIRGMGSTQDKRIIADGWLSDHMILMASGEWLVYQSHCAKEPPHDVSDICLAKGSDGKWYYTTCHFCVGMCALTMLQYDQQPSDLAFFVKRYYLREFDGKSDECLKKTKSAPDQM